MQSPDFFAAVPSLTLRDPLANFLGAATDGIIEYHYLDVVKLAGHSCPTVAGAYMLTHKALHNLYKNELPERGAVRVEFKDSLLNGVTGVIANVVTMLTGATVDTGFKGLGGQFDRRDLMAFDADIPLEIRFTRLDTGTQVDGAAHLRQIAMDPDIPALMQRCLQGSASTEERRLFGMKWQDRVRRILLEHGDDPTVFAIHPVTTQA